MNMLLDQEDAERALQEKLDSHEWWCFVGVSRLLSEVERRFYDGEANADLELLLGPPLGIFAQMFPGRGILPLALARKRRMSAEQLGALLRERGVPEEQLGGLGKRDILFVAEQ